MNRPCSILIYFSLLTIGTKALSQISPYRFLSWNTSHGLSTNFCNKVAIDANGYLFVGTATGINRFNSSFFQPLQNTYAKISNEGNVEDLLTDGKGRLWFADIANGLGVYNLNSIALEPPAYYMPDKNTSGNGTPGYYVSKLAFDDKGCLWVGTRGHGLYRFDTASKKFFYLPFTNPTSTFSIFIRSLFLYKPDTLFVGLVNGLTIVNPLTSVITHVPLKYNFTTTLNVPTIRKIIHWNKDTFAVATDRGAYFLQLPSGLISKINASNSTIQLNNINCNDILKQSPNELWLATERHGVIFFDTHLQSHRYSFENRNIDECIPEGFVSSFFTDNDQNVWVSHQFGLSVYRKSAGDMINFSLHDKKHKLTGGVLLNEKTDLLIFNNEELVKFNPLTNKISSFPLSFPPNTRPPKMALRHPRLGYVIFCQEKIFAIDTLTLKVSKLPVRTRSDTDSLFFHFLIEECIVDSLNGEEIWWLMSPGNRTGLFQYNPATGFVTAIDFANKGSAYTKSESSLTDMVKDSHGGLWISTQETGLYYMPDRTKQKTIRCDFNKTTTNRKPTNYISDLLLDSDNAIWCSLYGIGIVKLNGIKNGRFHYTLYNENNNLDNPYLARMQEDRDGNIWITSANDLYCFSKKKQRFRRLTTRNGIRNARFDLFNTETIRMEDGGFFYSDLDNLLYFHPQNVFNKIDNPKLILSGLQVNKKFYNLVSAPKVMEFSVEENSPSFFFDILDYDNAGSYTLLAKMDGYEKDWYKVSSASQLNYRKMPGGNYNFRMKIVLPDGSEANEQSLQFNVATAWYRTWLFYALGIITIAGLVLLLYQYKLKQQLKIFNVRQRLHRDLHDDVGATLSSVKVYADLLGRDGNNEVISGLIRENASEMMDRLEVISWATDPEHDNFKSLVDAMLKFARPVTHAHGIDLSFNQNGFSDEMMIPGEVRQHVFLIFKEAINNMIKYAAATQCHVSLLLQNQALMLQINDNGKGNDGIIKGGGSGVKNMHKRAEEMNGQLEIKTFEDQGTLVRLIIAYPFKI